MTICIKCGKKFKKARGSRSKLCDKCWFENKSHLRKKQNEQTKSVSIVVCSFNSGSNLIYDLDYVLVER